MIAPITWPAVEAIARHMRDIDRREICGIAATDDPVQAVSHLQYLPNIGAVIAKDEPVAVIGAVFLWPGVASVFMFATDRWPEAKVEGTRFARNALRPALRDAGIHRLQCFSLAEHTDAHAWLRYLGADREVEMPEYGKNRENYVLFEMSRNALERVTSVEK